MHRLPTILGASAAGGLFALGANSLAHNSTLKTLKRSQKYITPDLVDKAMDLPEIKKLGVTLIDSRWNDLRNDAAKRYREKLNKLKEQKKKAIPKCISKLEEFVINSRRKELHSLPMGNQAYNLYNPLSSKSTIMLNKQRGGAFLFHELGHAKNFGSKGIAKILTVLRKPYITIPLIMAGLLCATIPRATEEKGDTFWGKTKNILKDSCVGITALGAMAVPLEEGVASIRGAKIAKQVLSKEQLKAVNKINLKAFCTYGSIAGGAILATYLASKITDKIVERKNEQVLANEIKDENTALDVSA